MHVSFVFAFVPMFVFVIVFVVVFLSIASRRWRFIKGTLASMVLPVAARLQMPMHMIFLFVLVTVFVIQVVFVSKSFDERKVDI